MKLKFYILSVNACLFLCLLSSYSYGQTLASGAIHTLVICDDGTVEAWGWNVMGQLGNGTGTSSNVPIAVDELTDIVAVGGGGYHSMALKADGTLLAWGGGTDGQLGHGVYADSPDPVAVNISGVVDMGLGGYHSVVLKSDGTVWSFGQNSVGQLGTGDLADTNSPVQVTALSDIVEVASGGFHSLAVKNDGTVWAWGENAYGQLGNGDDSDTDLSLPVQVLNLTDVIAVAAGGLGNSVALKSDGTVWTWGHNVYGELGNGSDVNMSSIPVQVSNLDDVIGISASAFSVTAVKSDGTVWTWGMNYYGQLGIGTNDDSNIPVQVSGLSGVIEVAGGNDHVVALKNDGTAWSWGRNLDGQLGNGNNNPSNIPVEVTGLCQASINTDELLRISGITVYPNPLNELVIISGTKSNGEMLIIDMLQKEVYRQSTIEGKTILNLANLLPGIYLARYTEGTHSVTIRMVKC